MESADDPYHPQFDNMLYINVYGMHNQFKSASRRIRVFGDRQYKLERNVDVAIAAVGGSQEYPDPTKSGE